MEQNNLKFKALLDEHHIWPTPYVFKFVVLANQVDELTNLLNEKSIFLTPSRKGKYISVTLEKTMNSSQEVVNIYEKVWAIEGIISL